MTVENEQSRVIVAGNAVTTAFSFSFPIPGSSATDQTNAELLLFGTDSSITVLADNLWSITGVDTGVGGTFTYPLSGPAITTGAFLTLTRIVPYEQTTTLSGQGAYSPAVVEAALDNLAFQTEQLNTWRLQSIRAPITDAALADLPTKAWRAGAFLKFDSNGDPSTASSTSGLAGSILVGTNSTSSTLTTDLLITGSAVTSVVTVAGVTTATLTGGNTPPGGSSGQIQYNNSSAFGGVTAMSGDATLSIPAGVLTLSTSGVTAGTYIGATVTVDAKGRVTSAVAGGGGAGALILLETHTASSSASVNFTTGFSDTYTVYELVLDNIVSASDTQLSIQVGTGGGPTYQTSGYRVVYIAADTTAPTPGGGAETSASSLLGNADLVTIASTAGRGFSCKFLLTGFRNASNTKHLSTEGMAAFGQAGGTAAQAIMLHGEWQNNTTVTALKISLGTGNIASGVMRLYGLANS